MTEKHDYRGFEVTGQGFCCEILNFIPNCEINSLILMYFHDYKTGFYSIALPICRIETSLKYHLTNN